MLSYISSFFSLNAYFPQPKTPKFPELDLGEEIPTLFQEIRSFTIARLYRILKQENPKIKQIYFLEKSNTLNLSRKNRLGILRNEFIERRKIYASYIKELRNTEITSLEIDDGLYQIEQIIKKLFPKHTNNKNPKLQALGLTISIKKN